MSRNESNESKLAEARQRFGGLDAHKKLIEEMTRPTVFVGDKAQQQAASMGARAFATGVNPFALGDGPGADVQAHEASHVVQQKR